MDQQSKTRCRLIGRVCFEVLSELRLETVPFDGSDRVPQLIIVPEARGLMTTLRKVVHAVCEQKAEVNCN